MAGTYSFGDDARAATRLALLAETFAPTTTSFVRARAPHAPRRVVDLGCGPGHTSALLAELLSPVELIAVDSSDAYARAAAERLAGAGTAVTADVTLPLPALDGADVVFARFLLTHLPEPERAVAGWLAQLSPGAVLLLEEVDGIDCDVPVLARYLDVQRAMLAARGQTLDVGARVDAAVARGVSEVARLTVPAAVAARMFAMNFASWRDDDAVALTEAQADALADELERVPTDAPALTWRMRQAAIAV